MNVLQAPKVSTEKDSSDRPSAIVFIDGTVEDAEQLALSTLPGVEAVLLDPTQDGIAQITATLANRSNITGVHLIGHGSSGRLRLGSSTVNQETIAQYADSLNQWKTALTEDADLLLYGCNVAADPAGQAFVNRLSQLTDADVAASDDLTGNAALGGDWLLEYTTGLIDSPLALQVQAMQAYQDVFADFQASNANELSQAILAARSTPGNDRIFITGSITLTGTLPVLNGEVELIGTGQTGAVISGANGVNRLFKASGGNIRFSNLTLQNGVAQGATGINGGGGGLGAGGALFVENATVEINNVAFRNNTARGGDSTGTAGRGGNGGNLGFGGDNGAAGGKGGGFDGSAGGAGGAGGLNGFQANRDRRGGDGLNGANGGFGEGGGAGGGGGGGQSVFFLIGALFGNGGNGGQGGQGGFGGGSGGSGGGGGGSDTTFDNVFGGTGGNLPLSSIAFGGRGASGANGLSGGPDVDVLGGAGGAGGRGGGGAGLGGAIFARNSTVTVRNSGFENNRTIAGTGANPGRTLGADIFSLDSMVRLQNNQFSNPDNAAAGEKAQFIEIIPNVSITPTSTTLGEGSNLDFTFSIDDIAPANGLTLNFVIEGSATAASNPNADHSFQTGSVIIPGGQSSVVLKGTVIDDLLPELSETLTLRLLPGSGYRLPSQSAVSVQIQDNDVLVIGGTGGDDLLTGTAAPEQINGNAGNDTIDGNGGTDFIFGDAGNDRIIWDSGDGNDIIDGGDGNDTLVFNCSNRGDRLIVQQAPNNTLQLLRNRPVAVDLQATNIERLEINCLNGSDGVAIRDTSTTGTTSILVRGGSGRDTITGIGATAELELVGNANDDVLTGGKRNDQLRGGAGRDSFVFNSDRAFNTADLGIDRILDFARGSDRIVLDQTTFGNLDISQIAIVDNDALAATSAGLITYSRATGSLFFNQNGAAEGFGTGRQFATLQNNPALTVNNFQIVA